MGRTIRMFCWLETQFRPDHADHMDRSRTKRLTSGLGLVCLCIGMVACSAALPPTNESTKSIDIVRVTSGLPPGEPSDNGGTEAFAKFVSAERASELSVVTFGSSSCPAIPQAFRAHDHEIIDIVLVVEGGEICSADLGPTTTVVTIPEGYALATNLLIDGVPARLR